MKRVPLTLDDVPNAPKVVNAEARSDVACRIFAIALRYSIVWVVSDDDSVALSELFL